MAGSGLLSLKASTAAIAPYTDYNLSVNTDSEAEQRMSQGHPGSEREGHRATMAFDTWHPGGDARF
jgi:hypothetical protein